MTGSPEIRVVPSQIDGAAAKVQALGAAVRSSGDVAETAFVSRAALAVGDPATGDALVSTTRLVQQAIAAAGTGVDDLARAMGAATDTYRLSEASAVPVVGR